MIAVLLDLGASVVLPVFIFLIGLILKVKPGQAFRAGLTVGIGFVGINLVINLLVESLGPAAKDMVKQWGTRAQGGERVGTKAQGGDGAGMKALPGGSS
ncbi:PTS transporter subunit IIC [Nocardia sp.]|uniref:PTS transporter subunit IIC n=1 Tax=Nocardia sp. TaxID=1821 RepID=UPI002583BB9D|nr:PTS transporter subunit IIC [Nocardia sp.]